MEEDHSLVHLMPSDLKGSMTNIFLSFFFTFCTFGQDGCVASPEIHHDGCSKTSLTPGGNTESTETSAKIDPALCVSLLNFLNEFLINDEH